MKGRQCKQESRAAEFRQRLLAWKQTPESLRPSLRALASELGTSHQLLKHYLAGLEKWEYQELYRKAKKEEEEIRGRAKNENRALTPWEEQELHTCDRAMVRGMVGPALLDSFEEIKQAAKRGPLHWAHFKMVQIFARQGFPEEARELLEKCSKEGPRKRKSFAEIVRDTPRHAGEASDAWVRRIWNECEVYGTDCPTVITEEVLERCSRGTAKARKDNLPLIASADAKFFGSVGGDTGNSAKAEGRRSHAQL